MGLTVFLVVIVLTGLIALEIYVSYKDYVNKSGQEGKHFKKNNRKR